MLTEFQVTGMTCEHCARKVEKALNGVPGVRASVSYARAMARVETATPPDLDALRRALDAHGYGLMAADEATRSGSGDTRLHIVVIGSGAAAFAAAIRAADAGARVTMIERDDTLGGTCVNVGCVPSKIMLRAAEVQHQRARHPFAGIARSRDPIERGAQLAQLRARVEQLRADKYEQILHERPEITLMRGAARFQGPRALAVTDHAGATQSMYPDRILIACGASPAVPPIRGLADTPYWTSTDALFAQAIPEHLLVIGSSFVALELAQAYRRLGSEVTLVARNALFSRDDPDLGAGLLRVFEAEGIRVFTHTQVRRIHHDGERFSIDLGNERATGDRLLVAAGRLANTQMLRLDKGEIAVDSQGAIRVDDHLQTSAQHIYAAGDCTTLPQLVYVAAAAGTRAAINMTGGKARLDLSVVPAVVFTDPQIATVGLDEAQARARGIEPVSRRLDLENVPRALANFDTTGFIKLIADAHSHRLVGARILAHNAGEVIQTAALAVRHRMRVEELGDTLFPYLVMSEGLKLAAQTFTRDVRQLSCCAG